MYFNLQFRLFQANDHYDDKFDSQAALLKT